MQAALTQEELQHLKALQDNLIETQRQMDIYNAKIEDAKQANFNAIVNNQEIRPVLMEGLSTAKASGKEDFRMSGTCPEIDGDETITITIRFGSVLKAKRAAQKAAQKAEEATGEVEEG
jgi:hypothetical protein